jgi:hypothetical protein
MDDQDEAAKDRRALEQILQDGTGDRPWPTGALGDGTAVRVVREEAGHAAWEREFTGVIDSTMVPREVKNRLARPGELEYSVRFDSPQYDCSGGGPYRKAVIWDRYLRVLQYLSFLWIIDKDEVINHRLFEPDQKRWLALLPMAEGGWFRRVVAAVQRHVLVAVSPGTKTQWYTCSRIAT